MSPPPRNGTMTGGWCLAARDTATEPMWSTLPTCVVPNLSALPLPAATKSCRALERAVLADHQHLRIFGGARERHQVLVLVLALAAQDGEQVRLRDERDGVAVLRALEQVIHCRRAAAAGAVHHHELGLEYARRVDHHHARGDVGAAADAGVRHHLDRLRRKLVLGASGKHGKGRGPACETEQAPAIRIGHVSKSSSARSVNSKSCLPLPRFRISP